MAAENDVRTAASGKRRMLTKQQVIAAAYDIVDAEGVQACSMRALGSSLGVTAMALYGYVPSHEALLNEVAACFLDGIDAEPIPGEPWDDAFLRIMHAKRRACLQHPHLAHLLSEPCVSAGLEPYAMRLRALYIEQGMPEDIAVQLVGIADAFFTGFCLRSLQCADGDAEPELRNESAVAGRSSRFAVESRVPGMLTGKRGDSTRVAQPGGHRHRSIRESYSEQSFEAGLLVIVEGVRAGAAPDPCDWRTPIGR
ncbi:MAG: TetR family transcriptional regulator [Slackia sp.]|nr:TetR family transcriptional regulator [Slackia sp.]